MPNQKKSSHDASRMQNYEIVKHIDQGQFGTISLGKKRDENDRLVAIKQIPYKNLNASPKLYEMINSEIKVLKSISHKNVVKLLDSFELEKEIIMIYEYCEGGNAHSYIKANGTLTEEEALDWTHQIVQALNVTDQYGVVHRDIK